MSVFKIYTKKKLEEDEKKWIITSSCRWLCCKWLAEERVERAGSSSSNRKSTITKSLLERHHLLFFSDTWCVALYHPAAPVYYPSSIVVWLSSFFSFQQLQANSIWFDFKCPNLLIFFFRSLFEGNSHVCRSTVNHFLNYTGTENEWSIFRCHKHETIHP